MVINFRRENKITLDRGVIGANEVINHPEVPPLNSLTLIYTNLEVKFTAWVEPINNTYNYGE